MHVSGRFASAALLLFLMSPPLLVAQERQISGRVTRAGTDVPVPEAAVSVVGAGQVRAVLTNADGRYAIAAPAGEVRLQFRLLGYTPREVVVPAGTNIMDVALSQDVFRLSEVVVTGQATTIERRSATTAIAYGCPRRRSRTRSPARSPA